VALQPAEPEPLEQPPPLRHSLVSRIRGVWEERQRQVPTTLDDSRRHLTPTHPCA
jgi:hypothetical protein